MSTGLSTLASGDRSSESAERVSRRGRAGRARPPRRHRRRGSRAAGVREHRDAASLGSGWLASSAATSTSSSSESARMTPAWWKSASTATSEPASAAVCELAALWPVAVVPLLSARIGFVRATRRARRPKRRGLPNDSTYMSTTSVASSSSHHSRRSLVETSALLPIDTNADRPRPRDCGRLEQSQAERAALRGETDVAGRRRARGEGRVEARPGDRDAEAVGPDQPRAVGADEGQQLLLPLQPFAAGLGETRGDHDEGTHALAQRLLRRPEDGRAGKCDHREIDRVRDLFDRAVTRARPPPARRRD